tara:strand:+ start:653 stop:754 length:102 start_codon:yes stop_codon:yes gene_type:complete
MNKIPDEKIPHVLIFIGLYIMGYTLIYLIERIF